jgi:hypothetical protein
VTSSATASWFVLTNDQRRGGRSRLRSHPCDTD